MTHFFALWSIVFMMGFVIVFANTHDRHRFLRLFASVDLCSRDEVDRLMAIWAACQEE
jgi:hypothetical protein